MKPGSLVRLAPNMFNDQQVNASIMMIVDIQETDRGTMVDTLHDGRIYTFHADQLDNTLWIV